MKLFAPVSAGSSLRDPALEKVTARSSSGDPGTTEISTLVSIKFFF